MSKMSIFRRILEYALILVLSVAVVGLYLNGVHARNARQAVQQALIVQEAARNRELDQQRDSIFETVATAAKSVEGIVFWGDESLTVNRETSLPAQVNNRIEDALISPVISRMVKATGPANYPHDLIPINNMGVDNEGIEEILCRAGARKIRTGQDFEVREDVMARDIEMVGENGQKLLFASQQYAKFGNVSLQGISGWLYQGSYYYDSVHSVLAFGRDKQGEARTVPAGTVLEVESQQKYRRNRTVLFFGEHPEIGDEALVQCMKDLLSRQVGHEDQYVVVCTTGEGSALDRLLTEAFGDHYLRNDSTPEDMGTTPYQKLSQRVYEVLDRYGAFDEVKKGAEAAMAAVDALEATA